jgi:hypothetical protein
VSNKEISEPTYLEVKGIILKFKLQKAPGIDGIMAEILQKVGPAVWRRKQSLVKIIRNKEEMPINWKKGIVCSIYEKMIRISVTVTEE